MNPSYLALTQIASLWMIGFNQFSVMEGSKGQPVGSVLNAGVPWLGQREQSWTYAEKVKP